MEYLLEVPATPVSAEDVREIAKAERAIARQSLAQRVKDLAAAFNRAPATIRDWRSQGVDLYDSIAIIRYVQWANSRRRNWRDPDSRPRRARSPFD